MKLARHANFMILLLSGSIMAFGNKVYELALPLILYDLTQSSVAMSTMRGIEFLPNLGLALFIGVLVDRVHKKKWSLAAIALQIAVLLGLFFTLEYGNPPLFFIYCGGFLLMTFGYAFNNARVSMVKLALPTEMLTPANVAFSFASTLIGILGPALTGLMLMLPALHDGLFMTAASFSLAFVLLLFLRSDESRQSRPPREGFWKELREGWTELRRNRPLWLITMTVIFLNSTEGMVDTTVIFYAKDSLHLDNFELGMALSAAGVGGLLGSLAIGRLRRKYRVGVIITVTTLLIGVSYMILLFARSAVVLGIGLFVEGVFLMINSVCIWTFRQESTPPSLIGRVSGITGSLFKLGMPFAIYAAGWINELADPAVVFAVAMLGNAAIFAFCRRSALWK